MKKIILLTIFILSLVLLYRGIWMIYPSSEVIKFVPSPINQPANQTVRIKWKEQINRIKVTARGEISHSVLINKKEILAGVVDAVLYEGDWYSSEYMIDYQPEIGTSGKLEIELIFMK